MISGSEIEIAGALAIIREMENSKEPHIDGRALSSVVKLIFYAGLKKKEVIKLRIRDVLLGNDIVDQIVLNPGDPPIQLSNDIKGILTDYIQYLRAKPGASVAEDSPLFSDYSEESGEKKFSRHLEKYRVSFDDLHKGGIKIHYWTLRRNGADHKKALEETAIQFRTSQRNVKDKLKGITKPAGRKPLDEQAIGDRIMHFLDEAQRLTKYEIWVEDKVQKSLTDFYSLVDNEPELSKDGAWWKDYFVRHLIENVDRDILKQVGVVKADKNGKVLPKDEEVAALKNALLIYIERRKESLSEQERAKLEDQKKAFAFQDRRKEKLGKRKKLGRITIRKPSKEEIRERKRIEKEEREEEKRWLGGTTLRIFPENFFKKLKELEKRRIKPAYFVGRISGTVEKVHVVAKSVVVETEDEKMTFVVTGTTSITEANKVIPLGYLKKGMDVAIRYERRGINMVATAIKVAAPLRLLRRKKAKGNPKKTPKK